MKSPGFEGENLDRRKPRMLVPNMSCTFVQIAHPNLVPFSALQLNGLFFLICRSQSTSSTRTRRGGSCPKDIYETFLIYRTCMRRAPAKPVRAFELARTKCFAASRTGNRASNLSSNSGAQRSVMPAMQMSI